jgi:hypothetical protein
MRHAIAHAVVPQATKAPLRQRGIDLHQGLAGQARDRKLGVEIPASYANVTIRCAKNDTVRRRLKIR